MANKRLTNLTAVTSLATGDLLYVVDISDTTDSTSGSSRKITFGNLLANLPLNSPVLTTPQINDTSSDHQYIFAVSELAADRTVTLPLLTGNDEFVFQDHTQALTNKTLTSPVLQGNVDGWISANESWTYASASTITVPAGAASKYQKGDRIKFTQTTVKYGVIVAVADTLLTIAVNTDYVVANAAITLNYYSHELNPLGYPTWFNWTPGWTGFSANPTTTYARYAIFGAQISINFCYSGVGTSNDTVCTVTGFPVAIATNDASAPIWPFVIVDNGTNYIGAGRITGTTLVFFDQTFDPNGWTNTGQKAIYGFGITYQF